MDSSRNFQSEYTCLTSTHIKKQNMNRTLEPPFPTSSHYPRPKETTIMILTPHVYMCIYIVFEHYK